MSTSKRKSATKLTALIVAADILVFGASTCVFALFHHVLPKTFHTRDLDTEGDSSDTRFGWDDDDNDNDNDDDDSDIDSDDDSDSDSDTDDDGGKMTESEFWDKVIASKNYRESEVGYRALTELGIYFEENARIASYMVEYGSGDDKVTYYVADIYVANLAELRTYVATDEEGKVTDGVITDVAEITGAALCVNGDYFKSRTQGTYIRNGVLYLSSYTDSDICVIYTDGSMACYDGRHFNSSEAIAKGVWQAWTFGPSLLFDDGSPITDVEEFNISGSYIVNRDSTSGLYGFQSYQPRTAIGCVAPGHYILMVVDGRNDGYSRGVTLQELSVLMYDEGCTVAYNLDGGGSSVFWFDGKLSNRKSDDVATGRKPSDFIYIADINRRKTGE